MMKCFTIWKIIFGFAVVLMASEKVPGQETVFSIVKGRHALAEKYFSEKNYHSALGLFEMLMEKDPGDSLLLRIAECNFHLKQFGPAADAYLRFQGELPRRHLVYCAEALTATGDYRKAIEYYTRILKLDPENAVISNKVWQLSNISFLFEDSLHFALRPFRGNTRAGELCARPFGSGVVFLSNRRQVQVIENVDVSRNIPFYRWYYLPSPADSTSSEPPRVMMFGRGIDARFHLGPLCFYDSGRRMVYSSAGESRSSNTLKLSFAEITAGGIWRFTGTYPFNGDDFSITDPFITEDGNILFFSSDMPGGLGGKDLYRSRLSEGRWTTPENLGPNVNTSFDECYPFIFRNTLYFASAGHAGMGGLDLFKSAITGYAYGEPVNIGYPVNSAGDDFGIFVDSTGKHGYVSSNRLRGGFDDDVYEFDMDLQIYPVRISGVLKFKEHQWSDSSTVAVYPGAKMTLVDKTRDIAVMETVSGRDGSFSIVVPYFSQFVIRITGSAGAENIVSLEMPKHTKEFSEYDIVVVKDPFKTFNQVQNEK